LNHLCIGGQWKGEGADRFCAPTPRNKTKYEQKTWVETAFFGFQTAFFAIFLKQRTAGSMAAQDSALLSQLYCDNFD